MTDRFKILLEKLKLTPSEFADRIGVQRSSISHILSGRNKPSIDFLEKTLEAFPEVDVKWLITGKEPPEKINKPVLPAASIPEMLVEDHARPAMKENKTPALQNTEPVEKIIIVYRDNTFRILSPSED